MKNLVFDSHQDLYYATHIKSEERFQTSLSAIRHCKLVHVSIWIPPEKYGDGNLEKIQSEVLWQLKYYQDLEKSEDFIIVRGMQEVDEVIRGSSVGLLIHLEGAEAINSPDFLHSLYLGGVRSVGLTWNRPNLLATSCVDDATTGLTELGKNIVRRMIQQKMIVDVAHLNEAGFEDVYQLCRQAKYPFVCSHGNCRALCDDPRNLSDTQLRAIGEVNGMIGIFGAAKFVSSDPHANIHHLIHHISHARLKVGDENVGIGSDFGGISKVLDGFEAVSSFNHLAGKLYKRGFKKWQVEQTLSENWLNFYRRIWSK